MSSTCGCGVTMNLFSRTAFRVNSATLPRSSTSPAATTEFAASRPSGSGDSRSSVSSAVSTPIGHTQLTPIPASPYVIASHSANPTAACLLTAYAAAPSWVSSPAADATETKYPPPRSSQSGTNCVAARMCARRFTSRQIHIEDVDPVALRSGKPGRAANARVRDVDVHRPELCCGERDQRFDVGYGARIGFMCDRLVPDGRNAAGGLLGPDAIDVADDDTRTGRCERSGQRAPNSGPCAGDDGHLAFDLHVCLRASEAGAAVHVSFDTGPALPRRTARPALGVPPHSPRRA